jgi:hypothetical protein
MPTVVQNRLNIASTGPPAIAIGVVTKTDLTVKPNTLNKTFVADVSGSSLQTSLVERNG